VASFFGSFTAVGSCFGCGAAAASGEEEGAGAAEHAARTNARTSSRAAFITVLSSIATERRVLGIGERLVERGEDRRLVLRQVPADREVVARMIGSEHAALQF